MPKPIPAVPEIEQPDFSASPIALGGLLFGIGVLDAQEVMRYMNETFRQQELTEGDKQHE